MELLLLVSNFLTYQELFDDPPRKEMGPMKRSIVNAIGNMNLCKFELLSALRQLGFSLSVVDLPARAFAARARAFFFSSEPVRRAVLALAARWESSPHSGASRPVASRWVEAEREVLRTGASIQNVFDSLINHIPIVDIK